MGWNEYVYKQFRKISMQSHYSKNWTNSYIKRNDYLNKILLPTKFEMELFIYISIGITYIFVRPIAPRVSEFARRMS